MHLNFSFWPLSTSMIKSWPVRVTSRACHAKNTNADCVIVFIEYAKGISYGFMKRPKDPKAALAVATGQVGK